MKTLFLIVLIAGSFNAFSQTSDMDSQTQLDSMKVIWRAELEQQAVEFGIGTFDDTYGPAQFRDSAYAMLQIDTFIVEGIYSRQLRFDETTFGMNRASMDCEKEYDALMTKYYNLYLTKLNSADKKILTASQKSWLKFRDAERKVNEMMIKKEYSGGGSIQQLIYASQHLYITRLRALELASYMTRME